MNYLVVGISFRTAPVEIREKVFLSSQERKEFLVDLGNNSNIQEAIIISTCNRTEIFVHFSGNVKSAQEIILNQLFQLKEIPEWAQLEPYFYSLIGNDVVRHFLNVAVGLDSLILGEKQILGQIKKSVDMSRENGMLSKQFNLLSNLVIRAGKKAQNETKIGCGGASVSWAAVQLAEQSLGELLNKSILIIGAGKMSELTTAQLANKGVRNIYVVNRTRQKAMTLAEKVGGKAYSFLDMYKILTEVDLCIVSASAPHYLIGYEQMLCILQKRQKKKLLCIDISTPRNIDPMIAKFESILLYNIDDLKKVVDDNMKRRQTAIEEVKRIVDDKIIEFNNKLFKNNFVSSLTKSDFLLNY